MTLALLPPVANQTEQVRRPTVTRSHSTPLLNREADTRDLSLNQRRPASSARAANLRFQAEGMLRELAFVYQAARAVRRSITEAETPAVRA